MKIPEGVFLRCDETVPSAVSPPLSTRSPVRHQQHQHAPSPSPPARVPITNDHCRRQFDGPIGAHNTRTEPGSSSLLDHHACQPGRRHHRLRYIQYAEARGWRRGKARRHKVTLVSAAGIPCQRIRHHREQGGRSTKASQEEPPNRPSRKRRHKIPKFTKRSLCRHRANPELSKTRPYSR